MKIDQITITNAKYIKDEISDEPSIIKATIDGVEWFVPLDPANTDYAEIMRLVEAGELTIEPADEVAP